MNKLHIQNIQIVAQGLERLIEDVVFVGGAVAHFYATDPAAEEARISDDIDCFIEMGSKKEYRELERLLEAKGFQHDTSPGSPICRWLFQGIPIDIMPTYEKILGFSNNWYIYGIENKIEKQLPDGLIIFILPPEIYIASKLEAFNSRGKSDLRQSSDFEDIIFVLNNNADILSVLKLSVDPVKSYLRRQFQILLGRPDILEGIECALPYNTESDSVEKILAILDSI